MKALVERRHEKGAISNLGQSPTFMLAEDCGLRKCADDGQRLDCSTEYHQDMLPNSPIITADTVLLRD